MVSSQLPQELLIPLYLSSTFQSCFKNSNALLDLTFSFYNQAIRLQDDLHLDYVFFVRISQHWMHECHGSTSHRSS